MATLSQQAPMTTPSLPGSTSSEGITAPARILVVDDEPAIVDAVTYNLRLQGFSPLVASDADAALRALRERNKSVLDVVPRNPDRNTAPPYS